MAEHFHINLVGFSGQQHQLAALLTPLTLLQVKHLQMFFTCMMNMVATPAPVLTKLLANQFFSFPKHPWGKSTPATIRKSWCTFKKTTPHTHTHDHLLPDVVGVVEGVAGVLLAARYRGIILPVFHPVNPTTLKLLTKPPFIWTNKLNLITYIEGVSFSDCLPDAERHQIHLSGSRPRLLTSCRSLNFVSGHSPCRRQPATQGIARCVAPSQI